MSYYNLDKQSLFWQWIDEQSASITLNLKPLFLSLDLVILRHEELCCAVEYLQERLLNPAKTHSPLPDLVTEWLGHEKPYIMPDDQLIFSRFAFFVYYQLANQIKTNKLTLKYTVKHKQLDDDLMPESAWQKEKNKILRNIQHDRLTLSSNILIEDIKHENETLMNLPEACLGEVH